MAMGFGFTLLQPKPFDQIKKGTHNDKSKRQMHRKLDQIIH